MCEADQKLWICWIFCLFAVNDYDSDKSSENVWRRNPTSHERLR